MAQQKKKLAKETMEGIILNLCQQHYLTLQVLAQLLHRTSDALRQQYLKPLVEAGKLRLAFPTAPTHPHQAYISVEGTAHDE
jgi:hypothetical protein